MDRDGFLVVSSPAVDLDRIQRVQGLERIFCEIETASEAIPMPKNRAGADNAA